MSPPWKSTEPETQREGERETACFLDIDPFFPVGTGKMPPISLLARQVPV